MRIAVVNEVSTAAKNPEIMEALQETGHEIFNVGMTSPTDTPELTYLQTGLISALLLQLGLVDMVIGGCGTGQGYLNAVLQYPGVTCALITEPLDAWLALRINAPNCISLALNKGYGWAGNVNLKLIFQSLLADVKEKGYPPHRVESQSQSREKLKKISAVSHRSMCEILKDLDDIAAPIYAHDAFCQMVKQAPDSDLKTYILSRIGKG